LDPDMLENQSRALKTRSMS